MSQSSYSVRIGKRRNTVYVRTPKGRVLRYHRAGSTRARAKDLARQVRSHLKRGGTLTQSRWIIVK